MFRVFNGPRDVAFAMLYDLLERNTNFGGKKTRNTRPCILAFSFNCDPASLCQRQTVGFFSANFYLVDLRLFVAASNHFLMFQCCVLQWMFGVMLWELTTLAQQPYLEVDPFEMAAYLRDGYRLAQPLNCPDEL